MNKIIEIKNLKKYFDKGKTKALDGVSLETAEGELLAIMGPSGSGKSTLLNMIGGLEKPDEGKIIVDGKNLSEISNLNKYRASVVGFIFQLHNLLPNLTAQENVLIPMFEKRGLKGEKRDKAKKLLEQVGLTEKENTLPIKLSGGERQKVAIARALANNPKIILADEPTGNLDSKSGEIILKLIKELQQKNKVTTIMVTHEKPVAQVAQRIVYMKDGKIIN